MSEVSPVKVFVSYKKHNASDDRAGRYFVEQFANVFSEAARAGAVPVDIWFDKQIQAGAGWEPAVEEHLTSAHIYVVVLSPGFFHPDGYIAKHELPVIAARIERERDVRRQGRTGSVLPVVRTGVRLPGDVPAEWSAFTELQAAFEGRPVGDLPADDRLAAFSEVATALLGMASAALAERQTTSTRPIVEEFREQLKTRAESRAAGNRANPEDQLKRPVMDLMESLAPCLGTRTDVATYSESPMGQEDVVNHVRLDLAVVDTRSGSAIGHVELKEPGKGADPTTTEGKAGWDSHDKQQWRHLREHPNLVYSNGRWWTLLRDGVRVGSARLPEHGDPLDDESLSSFTVLIANFLAWSPFAPRTARGLARRLAPLTRLLRESVTAEVTAADKSANPRERALWRMREGWQELLMPDATIEDFADSYAQTFTYALLLARLSDEITLPLDPADVGRDLRTHGHMLLGSVIEILGQEDARRSVSGPIRLLETTIAEVDPAKLSHRRETWLYFYEDFLAEYDPKRRKDAGVYYTPIEIVAAQVRLVDHVLRTRFGVSAGFGDDTVTILDPAAGTGTYLLTITNHVLDRTRGEGRSEHTVATSLARRMYGFELLVGAYAVAHLRTTQALSQAGATLSADGVNILLTDTLSAPHPDAGTMTAPTLMWSVGNNLAEEQRRSDVVKSTETPITVIIGNPPYDRGSKKKAQRGEGEASRNRVVNTVDGEPPLLDTFTALAQEAGAGQHIKNLYNLYVYFWRWAIWKACEQADEKAKTTAGPQHHGIVSFITSSSFLRGPGFVGMREHMRRIFDEIWVIDLGGEGRGARAEENLFAIRTPVAIVIGVQRPKTEGGRSNGPTLRGKTPAAVHYRRISGTGQEKKTTLDTLLTLSVTDPDWTLVSTVPEEEWTGRFAPSGDSEFWDWPDLGTLFPWTHSGAQYKRTWPIAPSPDALTTRWTRLFESGTADPALLKETRDVKIHSTKADVVTGAALVPLASETARETTHQPVRYGYRSFDRMWCLPDSRLGDFLRPSLWRSASDQQVFLATLTTTALGAGPAVTVSANVPDMHVFRGSFGARNIHPLWRDAAATQPNLNAAAREVIGTRLGRKVSAADLMAYVFGLLGTGAYTIMFAEDLTESVPRVPITEDVALFERVVEFGREMLVQCTFAARFSSINEYGQPEAAIVTGQARVGAKVPPTPYPESFKYDRKSQVLRVGEGAFTGVRPDVWDFQVSGLKVVQSWLGYRMAVRKGRKSSDLDYIHPQEWAFDQELLDLLWVIEFVVNATPRAAGLLQEVVSGPLLVAKELPLPSSAEVSEPLREGFEAEQLSSEPDDESDEADDDG